MDTDYVLGIVIIVFIIILLIIGLGYLMYNIWKSNRNDNEYNKI
jgi:F0F1-type ATP synthase assembly protein I